MPLAAQLPADGGFGLPHSSSLVHPFLFVQAYCLVCLSIANKGVYQEVLIPVGIALRVHIFCNGVRGYFSDISGFKFDEIAPSVKDRVLMCPWMGFLSASHFHAVTLPLTSVPLRGNRSSLEM